MFLFGRSNGGLIATNMCSGIGEKMFKAAALLTPFYRLANEGLYAQLPKIKIINFFHPRMVIKRQITEKPPEYIAKWGHIFNDEGEVKLVTPLTVVNWSVMQEKAKQVIKTTTVPLFMITAEKDETVSNKAIKDFFALSSNPKNKILHVMDCDHSNLLFDEPLVSCFIRDTINFFN